LIYLLIWDWVFNHKTLKNFKF